MPGRIADADTNLMHPMLNMAVKAARAAGDIIVRHIDRVSALQVNTKGRHDYVSEVDLLAEQAILQILSTAYPDHAFLAEESGHSASAEAPEAEYQWVIDPLDGTLNFLHGFPQFAVSIALKRRGDLYQAVIYDPMRQELFTASRGSGAQLDGRRIRVSGCKDLASALLGSGFPVRNPDALDSYLEQLAKVLRQSAGVRRPGAAALDLAYVASGRLDGFWESGLGPWDIAAGALLIQEAGGIVTDFSGGQRFLETGSVIAGSPKVTLELSELLRRPVRAAAASPG